MLPALLATLCLVPRPVLSGAEELRDTVDGRFRIHYTLDGTDAPPGGASDVDAVEAGLADVANVWIAQAGMRAPLADDGQGGDTRVDLYLRQLLGERGDTFPVDVGQAPATSAWIQLETRTAQVSPLRLSAAAAHEALHAVQYAYRADLAKWLYESGAAYVEHADFDDAALQAETDAHWASLLARPEIPLDRVDGSHEYDELVFVKFLIDHAGSPTAMPRLWQALAGGDVAASIAGVAGEPSLTATLARFGEWNLHACANDDGKHYNATWAACHNGQSPSLIALGALPSTRPLALAPLTLAYVSLPPAPCATEVVDLDGIDDLALGDDAGTRVLRAPSDSFSVAGSGHRVAFALAAGPGGDAALTLHADATGACPDGAVDDATAVSPPAPSGCGCALGVRQDARAALAPSLLLLIGLGYRRRIRSCGAECRDGRARPSRP